MPLITAVSFDEDGIRVVSGQRSRAGFTAEHEQLLAHDQLDAYLATTPCREFLIAINPPDALYETITIPPVDDKLTYTLANAEMARMHPELQPFSCSSQIVGELPVDGRTVRKIACCLVPHATLQPILEPFIRHNKTIRRLVTAPTALAPLVSQQQHIQTDALLCAHDAGPRKTLFLLEQGAVTFARALSSNGHGWDAIDRQNISMTSDYCSQTLRIRPSKILVLTPGYSEDEPASFPRLEPIGPPVGITASDDAFQDYLVPLMLAAFHVSDANSLLPELYRTEQQQQQVLRTITLGALAACLLVAVLIALRLFSVISLQETITDLQKKETGLQEVYNAHQEAVKQRDANQPLITAMNAILTPADIPRLLVAMNGLQSPGTSIQSLSIKRDKDVLSVQIAGSLQATTYAASQQQFETFMAAIQRIPGMTLGNRQQDPKEQTFILEGNYKP